jgi:predicted  nucleic acid-binding Zn-ribbon protein
MSAKNPSLPTAAEIRAEIDQADQELLAAQAALGEALFTKAGMPDRDVGAEQAAVDAARQRIDQFKAMLPVIERVEAQALAETRAKLAEEQRKRLARALRDLLKHSMSFSAHYQNAASAFRRMTAAGNEAARLLFDGQKQIANGGLVLRLSVHGLKALADQEINRIGLLPALRRDGEASAPGTNPTAVATAL